MSNWIRDFCRFTCKIGLHANFKGSSSFWSGEPKSHVTYILEIQETRCNSETRANLRKRWLDSDSAVPVYPETEITFSVTRHRSHFVDRCYNSGKRIESCGAGFFEISIVLVERCRPMVRR